MRNLKNLCQTFYKKVSIFFLLWTHNLLLLARFDKRTAPTVISVYNFSGVKPAAKDYVPGSDGAGPAPEMPHYRVEIDAKVWNGTSFKAKQELIEKVEQAPPLDGNGQLYLILQVG